MNAPKVTPEQVEDAISRVDYVVLPDNRTTVCMLTLDNGFTVRGDASCVCAENFDAELGRGMALKKAKDSVWPLLGFRLADRLMRERLGPHHRNAATGVYVTAEHAAANPTTTVRES